MCWVPVMVSRPGLMRVGIGMLFAAPLAHEPWGWRMIGRWPMRLIYWPR